jgi:hypothetical protein
MYILVRNEIKWSFLFLILKQNKKDQNKPQQVCIKGAMNKLNDLHILLFSISSTSNRKKHLIKMLWCMYILVRNINKMVLLNFDFKVQSFIRVNLCPFILNNSNLFMVNRYA